MNTQSAEQNDKTVILKPALTGPGGVFLLGVCLAGIPVLYSAVGSQDDVARIAFHWQMLAAVLGVLFTGWGLWGIIRRVRGKLYVSIDRQGLCDEMSRYRAGFISWAHMTRVLVKRSGLSGSVEVYTVYPVGRHDPKSRARSIRIHGLAIPDHELIRLREVSRQIQSDPRSEAWRSQLWERAVVGLLTIGITGFVLLIAALHG